MLKQRFLFLFLAEIASEQTNVICKFAVRFETKQIKKLIVLIYFASSNISFFLTSNLFETDYS